MLDKVSVAVDLASGFFPGIPQGAKTIVMQTSIVLDKISGGGELKSLMGEHSLVEGRQASDSIM